MLPEKLKAQVDAALTKAWNQGDLAALDAMYATGLVRHRTPFPDIEGLDDLKQYVADTRNLYPNLQFIVDEMLVEAEGLLARRWTLRGTLREQSPRIPEPPTGRQMTMEGCTIAHATEGKIVEEWEYADWLGLLQQLGVIPVMGEGGS